MLLSTCRSPRLFALPLAGLALAAVLVLMAGGAQATLIDRGHGFIYDTLQHITWTQDANINGSHDWQAQKDWAAGYSQHHSQYGTFDDWRLPTTLVPDASCSGGVSGGVSSGYNCIGSEMGHLFYVDGIKAAHMGLFTNVQGAPGEAPYYSSTEDINPCEGTGPPELCAAWAFDYGDGQQFLYDKYAEEFHGWAVRDGDIAPIPEPSTFLLVSLGLVGLAAKGRRRNRS